LALFLFYHGFFPINRVEIHNLTRGQTRGKGRNQMIKMFVTGALISKGYKDAEALRFSENTETPSVRFRIGTRVYDKRAENNHRFVNINVKAFGYVCERIKAMSLAAGTYVNLLGRYDEETWEDQTTREKKSAPVMIVDEIEFCHGNGKQNGDSNGSGIASAASGGQEQAHKPADNGQPPENFTGFEGFGGDNPFFPGN
jgi:single-stranded DNA-binding protein